ncbi:MAG: arsenate reductase [Schleiferiaceae bacterium]
MYLCSKPLPYSKQWSFALCLWVNQIRYIVKKIYHLATCTTCQRILKEWPTEDAVLREIKSEPITESELEEMKALSGSYESLFSKRAMKYRGLGLHEMDLTEEDFKKYILQEYTFLKRPVLVMDDQIFVGNSKKVVEAAKAALS